MSSFQSSTKPGLQRHLNRRPLSQLPEPGWLWTPPILGRFPRLEVKQGPLKSLLLKNLASKPQTALHHFLHHPREMLFHLWDSEELKNGSTDNKP